MIYKPWPIILIGLLHILEPITKILFYSIFERISPLTVVVGEISTKNYIHIFEFFFMFPIAGIAILRVRKWSLWVFAFIEIWIFFANMPYMSILLTNGAYLLFAFFILFFVLNCLVVVYLLVPAVRIAYLDPSIRWWESHPRYTKEIPCSVNESFKTRILNISRSGVFVEKSPEFVKGDIVEIEFESFEYKLKLKAKVIHNFSVNGINGFGLQFEVDSMTASDKKNVKALIRKLDESGAPRRPEKRNEFLAFFSWLSILFSTGKGLFPENDVVRKKR
ncbi:MAG: PilZ domain-containing protein [Halobacteriovoraceae bacterium]|nr:PilZ domain-containing protein [Halobacteriovoraceae bacterium]